MHTAKIAPIISQSWNDWKKEEKVSDTQLHKTTTKGENGILVYNNAIINDKSLADTFKESKKNMIERFEVRKKESKKFEDKDRDRDNEAIKNKNSNNKIDDDKKIKKTVDRKELIERLNSRQRKKE